MVNVKARQMIGIPGLCAFGAALALPVAAWAQAPGAPNAPNIPNAGQTMRDLETVRPGLPAPSDLELDMPQAPARPAAPAEPGLRMTVQGFRITGNQAFASAQLLALLRDLHGSEQDLAGLRAAADRITAYYHEHGYVLARAFLPRQDIEDGVVLIEVMEGRYGQVELQNQSRVLDGVLRQPLAALRGGDAVQAAALESRLLLLNDLPGVQVRGTLRPGAERGATDLVVDAAPLPLVSGSVEADNYGGYYTGEYRFGGSLYLNSPLRLGDQLSLRVLGSDKRQRYYRAGYQVPFGPWLTRAGVAYSEMRYHLARDFAVLDAHGKAGIRSAFITQPLLRGRAFNVNAQLQYDDKRLRDDMDLFEVTNPKRVESWTLGVNANNQDGLFGGGQSMVSVSVSRGRLRLDDPYTSYVDGFTAHAAGRFSKLSLNAARLQRLSQRFQLYGQFNAQWASGNLDGSEKFGMGGPYGVRGYALGAGTGDQGWQASLELRYMPFAGWQFSAFVDRSEVDINRHPWSTGNNQRRLTAAGVGAGWTGDGHQVSVALAWPVGQRDESGGPVRSPRIWVQGAQYF